MAEHFDVIVVGGGMVGATLACGLGHSDLKVAVIEDRPPRPFSPEQVHDLRVSALSIASRKILATLGAWQGIALRRLCPFRRMRVWEERGETEFCSDDIDQPELGYIVENRIIQLALLERMQDFANITLLCPARTEWIDYRGHYSTVELDNGRRLSGHLLIAADGGQSEVRQSAGIGVAQRDYDQQALVLSVATAYEQQDITWQRFMPSGPQAFLPLPGRHASLVWYHAPEEVRRLKSLADQELLAELYRAFPDCLGGIEHILAKGSFPLKRQHAQEYVKNGVALIGDAAHMIHPLAGQGVNIGLLDAAALAQVLVTAVLNRQDIGALEVLKDYEAMRRQDNWLMMTTMDLFYRVFGQSNLPLKLFRNLGLGLADHLIPAKLKVMRYAMGLEGNLPRLARGEAIIA